MRIAVDGKNLALYGGGIAHWTLQVLSALVASRPDDEMILIAPQARGLREVVLPGARVIRTAWPAWLPRPLRHPVYDNVVFPRAISALRPGLVLSPYHDVRLPRSTPSVVTVHDLCYLDAAACYPRRIRAYYLAMLRLNVARARLVVTVSEATRRRIEAVLQVPPERIRVVPNALDPTFADATPSAQALAAFRAGHGAPGAKLVLYPGGVEYRKNVSRLVTAIGLLRQQGERVRLLVTGDVAARWRGVFRKLEAGPDAVAFLGHLSPAGLRLAYAAADAVAYPSLCEGFGRVCLEAMAAGTPLACSDLEVLREVAGDAPRYFDPLDVVAMAQAIRSALGAGRQVPSVDPRFTADAARHAFVEALEPVLAEARERPSP